MTANARLLKQSFGIHEQSRRTYGGVRITAQFIRRGSSPAWAKTGWPSTDESRIAALKALRLADCWTRSDPERPRQPSGSGVWPAKLSRCRLHLGLRHQTSTYVGSWEVSLPGSVSGRRFHRQLVGFLDSRNDHQDPVVPMPCNSWHFKLAAQSDGVILQSDQPTQFTCRSSGLRCKRAGIKPPLGSVIRHL